MPILPLNGVNLYYDTRGSGTPIVFIHPPLLTSQNFYYQMNELSREFQTVVFDIRGHGNSSFSEKPITYPLISRDIKQLLDHLGIHKAFICGYSTGGTIALDFLLSYPERSLGGVLLGGMPGANDRPLRSQISLGVTLASWKAVHPLALSISRTNSDTLSTFKKLYTSAVKGQAENIEQYYRHSLEYNCTSGLSNISLPVLLLYGQKDRRFRSYARLLSKKLPNNDYFLIGNVKHQIPTKTAADVNRLIRRFIHSCTGISQPASSSHSITPSNTKKL
ncbi:alpha/beta fold hydrolase [Bacillus thermotolerans]|uniref:Hydrolase n=1 Tax=Bacillus thermotolerans TaxID=1221996 RepID=A0A0F5I5C5_BACTR|nr:alpha/beta hydrolase [Bacillus thermotolerans]KKB37996.1 hydrolase [Bacillus thermotolerans]KKB40658.1 hydrolase [Bacillus thermotolerans]KKB43807.1 hydrolase [Bacillus thermotolerans]